MNKSEKPIIKHFNDFLDYLEIEKGLSSKTQENYSRFIRKFFKWLEGNNLKDLKPHELTSDYVWQYRVFLSRSVHSLSKSNLKKSTQNYYLIALRQLLAFFAERDIISLPADKIKLQKEKKERIVKFLELEQIEKLLLAPNIKTIPGLRDRAILESLFSTGLRISELTNLNRDQLKIKDNTDDLEIAVIGKGGTPRTVYFSKRAIVWLRDYLKTRNDKDKALFINYRAKNGSPMRLTNRSIESLMKKYSIIAGIPLSTTPHVLRHTYATDLLNQGVDLRTVQEFLGHRSIATTQIYTHVTSKRLRDVHRQFHSGKKLKE